MSDDDVAEHPTKIWLGHRYGKTVNKLLLCRVISWKRGTQKRKKKKEEAALNKQNKKKAFAFRRESCWLFCFHFVQNGFCCNKFVFFKANCFKNSIILSFEKTGFKNLNWKCALASFVHSLKFDTLNVRSLKLDFKV